MAIFTSLKKYFEVTAVSFTPNIITAGEETSYRVSVKNVSGKKITSMCADMKLYYRTTAGNVMGSNTVYMYSGNLEYNFKSISWANGVTKEFEGKFVFTPIYSPNIDTRLLPMFKGSDVGFTDPLFANARFGLMLNFTTSATFADGSNTDHFCDLRGENSENLYVIDARYVPSIPTFSAVRSTDSREDDEGVSALVTLGLGLKNSSHYDRLSLRFGYRKSTVGGSYTNVNIDKHMSAALAAETVFEMARNLDKSFDWDLRIWFGDDYESKTKTIALPRSFANVHLSGKKDGGVCFGSFSKAEDGKPLFQCYYPSEFEYGIRGVTNYVPGEVETGGRWYDSQADATDNWNHPDKASKKIYRFVWRGTTTLDGAQDTVVTLPSKPDMVISLRGMLKRTDGAWLPIPFSYYGGLEHSANIRTDASGNILVGLGSSYNGTKELLVIAEYTKS